MLWSVCFVLNDEQYSCMEMKYVKVSGHGLHFFKSVIYERNTDISQALTPSEWSSYFSFLFQKRIPWTISIERIIVSLGTLFIVLGSSTQKSFFVWKKNIYI